MLLRTDIAKLYIAALESGNIAAICELFADHAMVDSPIYGIMNASEFFKRLMDDTKQSKLRIHRIFEDSRNGELALYFEYQWLLSTEAKVCFDVVDIMRFDDSNKIVALKIIYDTHEARKQVNSIQ